EALYRAALAGLEQQIEVAIASHERVEADGDQAVGCELALAWLPRGSQPQRHPFAVDAEYRVRWNGDPPASPGLVEHENFRVEERDGAAREGPVEAGFIIALREHGHVVDETFEHDRGGGERLAAPPAAHRARIPRRRGMTFAERTCDQNGVGVDPGGGALRL